MQLNSNIPSNEGIIPSKMEVDTVVKLVLPPELSAFIKDVHHAQVFVGASIGVVLACVVLITLKRLGFFSKS